MSEIGQAMLLAAGTMDYWAKPTAASIAGLLIMGIHAFAGLTGWGKVI